MQISYKKFFSVLLCLIIILSWHVGNTALVAPALFPNPKNNFWVVLGSHMKLDHSTNNPRVRRELRRLLANKKELNLILTAASPYIYYIYSQTQVRKLPAEISLIPYIESQYNPNDHNSAGALGLWQLLPGTAKILGVKMKSGYDGRRNIIASTQAALLYLNDLQVYFKGNWNLAIAAYNCGQGRVKSATRRAGTTNFWQLSVPRDTRYYIPRLLALAEIIKNPRKYGVTLPAVDNAPYFSVVKVKHSVNLAALAKQTGVQPKILTRLNPDIKNGTQVDRILLPVNHLKNNLT